MKWRWLMCSVVLLSLVLALPASTQAPTYSLLTNGDFEDEDMSAWVWTDGTLVRTTTTVHSGNGAGALTMAPIWEGGTITGYQGHYGQCVDISGMTDWPAPGGTRYLTVNGYLMSDGLAQLRIYTVFYPNDDCTGTWLDSYRTSRVTSSDWTFVTVRNPAVGGDIRIPTGTNSVRIYFVGQSVSPGTFYVDDLAAFSSTVNAVRSRGMTARNGLWAAGLVGVAAVGVVLTRRRRA
jgi:hypothetical protein